MQTVLSGIQPTNKLHLGNYLGAIRQWVQLVNQGKARYIFMIADLHAMTVPHDPKALEQDTFALAAMYIALGLEPEKCILFVQSHNMDHPYLSWILETQTPYGWLTRMTQFKDKRQKLERFEKTVGTGLFTYPVLMAADILLYDTDIVPVGQDQVQHVELTRDIARRFNKLYGPVFKLPKPQIDKIALRIKDLRNPTKKMSKSDETGKGVIFLTDDADTIMSKFKRAVTDTLGVVKYDPENQPGVSNLITILAGVTGMTVEQIQQEYQGKGYAQFKQDVAQAVIEFLRPVQERYKQYTKDRAYVVEVLQQGVQKARELSHKKLAQVKKAVGLFEA